MSYTYNMRFIFLLLFLASCAITTGDISVNVEVDVNGQASVDLEAFCDDLEDAGLPSFIFDPVCSEEVLDDSPESTP